jgi:hypothetical protein
LITKLTIKTKKGKESEWTKEEAKELYEALHELFGKKEVYRDYYVPYRPYTVWCSANNGTSTFSGNAVSLSTTGDATTTY